MVTVRARSVFVDRGGGGSTGIWRSILLIKSVVACVGVSHMKVPQGLRSDTDTDTDTDAEHVGRCRGTTIACLAAD